MVRSVLPKLWTSTCSDHSNAGAAIFRKSTWQRYTSETAMMQKLTISNAISTIARADHEVSPD